MATATRRGATTSTVRTKAPCPITPRRRHVSCFGAGCHDASRNLSTVHQLYVGPGSENPEFNNTCDLCHANPAVDTSAAASMRCTPVCHSGTTHSGYAAGHALTAASNECVSCHPSDISTVHGASMPGPECATCHENVWNWGKTGDCLGCHNGTDVGTHAYTPSDPNHYSETTHTATPFTAAVQGPSPDGLVPPAAGSVRLATARRSLAHSSTSTCGGSITCVECHNDTTLASATTVAGNWPTRKCVECHDYGVATTHDSYATTHTVQPGTCAGTGASCHNFTDLASLHAQSQSGGAPTGQSCGNADPSDPSSCHNVLDARPTPVANQSTASCGQGTSGCHQDRSESNHGGTTSHTFTAASDAIDVGNPGPPIMSGCTNSSSGCHGTDPARANFTTYHPNSGCTAGACHTSPSKAGYAGNGDCQTCHDGSFSGAPTRATLNTDHYSETTHTAVGMNTPLTSGGTASATCNDCHNAAPTSGQGAGLKGLLAQHWGVPSVTNSTLGTYISCLECHSDLTRANGNAEVLAGWTNNACSDCHSITSGSPQHNTTIAPTIAAYPYGTCSDSGVNCHPSRDLHAIHKDAAGCNIADCHDFSIQAPKPWGANTCGVGGRCHTTYTNSTTHGGVAEHSPTNTAQETATFSGVACGACHVVAAADGGLVAEHSLATSVRSYHSVNICANCHNQEAISGATIRDDWAARDTTSACAACHTATLAIHATVDAGLHAAAGSAGCASTGPGCHNTGNLAAVGADKASNIHDTCLRCHDRTATAPNVAYDPANNTCGSCHAAAAYDAVTSVHNGSGGIADGTDGDHHTADLATAGYSAVFAGGQQCSTCHSGVLKTAHTASSVGTVDCVGCHNDTSLGSAGVVKANWQNDRCTDCHGASGVHTAYETAAGGSASHEATSAAGCESSGSGCHDAADLGVLHAAATNGCATCHATDKAMTGVAKTCGSGTTGCHAEKTADHAAAGAHGFSATSDYNVGTGTGCTNSGAGCHGTDATHSSFASYHPTSGCTAGECHTSSDKAAFTATYNGDATCASCHDSNYAGAPDVVVLGAAPPNGHYSETTHTATPFTAAVQGPSPDGLVPAGGRECSSCHSSMLGLAHSDTSTSGSSVTCVECHNDTTLGSSTTVAGNWPTRKCVECHDYGAATTHDSYATTHTVQPGTCAGTGASCHDFTDLASLHAQSQSGGVPTAQGCANADPSDPSSCHNVLDARPNAVTNQSTASCGEGTSGCHQEKTVSNHGAATAHGFTSASDYNAGTVSGCTNSGAGCHGSDSARDNFTTYHPDSGCTGGACHTSPSKPTYAGDRECVSCHSNNYVGAPDVVGLTDLTPAGHYNETTHTAFGMTTAVDAGGTASASCTACHNPVSAGGPDQLYAQHQGLPAPFGDTDCAACHSASQEVADVVANSWGGGLCAACHSALVLPTMTQHDTTAPPVTASTTDGCLSANCHPTSNLHAIHRDATGCNLTGCHDFSLQAAKPTETTCGAGGECHNSGGLHTYNHNATTSQECIDCHEQTDVSTLHANCAVCHRNPSYPSLPTGRTNECTGCHNGTVVGTHAYTPHDPQHYNPATTQHTASAQTGSESGYACTQCHSLELKPAHNGPTNITFNLSGYADKCVACHEVVVDNFSGRGIRPACGVTRRGTIRPRPSTTRRGKCWRVRVRATAAARSARASRMASRPAVSRTGRALTIGRRAGTTTLPTRTSTRRRGPQRGRARTPRRSPEAPTSTTDRRPCFCASTAAAHGEPTPATPAAVRTRPHTRKHHAPYW